jgi:hypothetical protein
VPILIPILSPRQFVSPLSLSPSFDFLDNPLIQHRPGCVTHRSGFFLVAGLNLLLIFDAMIGFLGFCLVGEKKFSVEGWVRQIGGENVCVLWAEGKIVI